MKKNQLILAIYDVLGILFLASIVIFYLKKDIIFYRDFDMEINDTIRYDAFNLYRGIDIVSIGKETHNFNYVDKQGNAISTKDCLENFKKYRENSPWNTDSTKYEHCVSLITDYSPRIAINTLRTTIGFHYNGDVHSSYVTTGKIVLFLNYIFIVMILILIRRFMQLTLKGEIFSTKGTNVFKYLFILSVLWLVYKYASNELIFRSIRHDSNIPHIYRSNGRLMCMTFSRSFNFYDFYYEIVSIVVTFFLYLAFKYGQKVKSENDLTV